MKKYLQAIAVGILVSNTLAGQPYQVTVTSGYGGGNFFAGDTVAVYCKALLNDETFLNWSADTNIEFLSDHSEWWSKFIMPAQDVHITANLNAPLPDDFLQFELIRGKDNLKKVYYHLDFQNKGIVFLFHGGNGQASNLVGYENYDKFYIVKQLIQNNYGVIISECEERTIHFDTDGSGNFTWSPRPYDTVNNPDYANFIAIRDTFAKKGLLHPDTPWFSWGMSNGGSFSSHFSYVFDCKAAAVYCASSQVPLVEATEVPILFALMPNDEAIGIQGNNNALANHTILKNRGVCTKLFMNEKMPLYPQYFMRSNSISEHQSTAIYNDLIINNCLDNKKFLIKSPAEIQSLFFTNPSQWMGINNLKQEQKGQVSSLISIAYGGHELFSNYCARTIAFFDSLCVDEITSVVNELVNPVKIFPNPVKDRIHIEYDNSLNAVIYLANASGQILESQQNISHLDITSLPNGVYYLTIRTPQWIITRKLIKIE